MNISKYFDKDFKKGNLSGHSNPEAGSKKVKDGIYGSYSTRCDIFEEGLESSSCKQIL